MAKRNYDAAPEPGRHMRTERDQIRGFRSTKPKDTDSDVREAPNPKNRVVYTPTNDE